MCAGCVNKQTFADVLAMAALQGHKALHIFCVIFSLLSLILLKNIQNSNSASVILYL